MADTDITTLTLHILPVTISCSCEFSSSCFLRSVRGRRTPLASPKAPHCPSGVQPVTGLGGSASFPLQTRIEAGGRLHLCPGRCWPSGYPRYLQKHAGEPRSLLLNDKAGAGSRRETQRRKQRRRTVQAKTTSAKFLLGNTSLLHHLPCLFPLWCLLFLT